MSVFDILFFHEAGPAELPRQTGAELSPGKMPLCDCNRA